MAAKDFTLILCSSMPTTRLVAAWAALCILGQKPAAPPKPGVKTPGVQIPIGRLTPDAVFAVPGAPDWMAIDEAVWVSKARSSPARAASG
jgi:hypothetical protein